MKWSSFSRLVTALTAASLLAGVAYAEGRLVVYCTVTNSMCENAVQEFDKLHNVKASFVRNSSGSTFAKVEAEKDNPQADIWYGGTFDPQSQAGDLGLLEAYKSPNLEQIEERLRDPAKIKGNYSSVIYIGILGFGVNTERLKKLGVEEVPKC